MLNANILGSLARRFSGFAFVLFTCVLAPAQSVPSITEARLESIDGTASIAPAGSQAFQPARVSQQLKPGDHVRVGPRSEVVVRLSDKSVVRYGANSLFRVEAPAAASKSWISSLLSGIGYYFHRDQPGDYKVESRTSSAAIRGTEFVALVDDAGQMTILVLDGVVELSNALGSITLARGEIGTAPPAQPPSISPAIDAAGLIQWTFYYPVVLDPADIDWPQEPPPDLSSSLQAYRDGNLRAALNHLSPALAPRSDAERLYLAALLLSLRQVTEFDALLNQLDLSTASEKNRAAALALSRFSSAVRIIPAADLTAPLTATEWIAESYALQMKSNLPDALDAARKAAQLSPTFGPAFIRVAELHFSFGHDASAAAALDQALAFAPQHAQAFALQGFLLAAQARFDPALHSFQRAIDLDPSLANAWLGRGLLQIRHRDLQAGLMDLTVASVLEPRRSILRSYLARTYADEHAATRDDQRASHELGLAAALDPLDPTPRLYSALLNQRLNKINQAIEDLEHSKNLNNNRSLYRSSFQLDQDLAVRSANLAHIYRDAGMTLWSIREAARSLAADYGNYSAHLFLANSYDAWRDPSRINLRYETPAESHYLLANLLAPANAGVFSRHISQGEYSGLFAFDRFGLTSATEYLSRGAWLQQGSQFGIFGNLSYSIEGSYRTDPGQRPNQDFEESDLRALFKQRLTARDSIFVQASRYHAEGGDRLQYYNPAFANPSLRTRERQEPLISLGYHREWNPGLHTLLLGSRLDDTIWVQNPLQPTLMIDRIPGGIAYVEPMSVAQDYSSQLEIYSAEAQQIWLTPKHQTVVGARFQSGDFDTASTQSGVSPNVVPWFAAGTVADQRFQTDFERLSLYAYHQWRVVEPLLLIGGLSYDRLRYPENFRASPVSSSHQSDNQLSPRAGFVYTPFERTALRAAYSRALSGASIDQSTVIEPAQVAGFNQSYRSLIPESVAGSSAGAEFDLYYLALEQSLPTRTYLSAGAELLRSESSRKLGAFARDFLGFAQPAGLREQLEYEERSLILSVDQLLGELFSAGAQYRVSQSDLHVRYPEILPFVFIQGAFEPSQNLSSTLHQLTLHTHFNHPSGFFARVNSLWTLQDNRGFATARDSEDFWQLNSLLGYRFFQRRAEISVGLLNITDQDYSLEPLSPYFELPRERTFIARLRLNF